MRKLLVVGLLSAVNIASAAQAQTTSCQQEGAQWVCHQQTDPYAAAAEANARSDQELLDGFNRNMAVLRERQAQHDRQQAAQSIAEYRQRVGRLISQGRCDDAKAVALDRGDMDLAGQAMRLCVKAEPKP